MKHFRVLVLSGAVGVAAGGTVATPASAAQRHYLSRSAAEVSLNVSPWAKKNAAEGACTGVGPSRRDVIRRKLYASFRCTVKGSGDGAPRGVVLVKATGPESVRVATVESGDVSGDVGLGALPAGRPRLRSIDLTALVPKTTWARGKQLFGVLCYGVGAYRDLENATLFSTFVCKVRVLSQEPAILLVQATSDRAVRVVRTLA
ncbi:hypothetical protein DSM104299_00131 [Baekduia alba]|uniref:hypothetical protein n=1 Tax=Baekduia alba TaxID=2997333 RepID=UPI002341C9BA|nr:hypothetical protein [Baekduia alba]WCB91460.1 hypothetical protein DSM104299_00131 [Baekduia alba]